MVHIFDHRPSSTVPVLGRGWVVTEDGRRRRSASRITHDHIQFMTDPPHRPRSCFVSCSIPIAPGIRAYSVPTEARFLSSWSRSYLSRSCCARGGIALSAFFDKRWAYFLSGAKYWQRRQDPRQGQVFKLGYSTSDELEWRRPGGVEALENEAPPCPGARG
jgi:hypothetical protein